MVYGVDVEACYIVIRSKLQRLEYVQKYNILYNVITQKIEKENNLNI